MATGNWTSYSIVTRLVAAVLLGGAVLSAALGVVSLRSTEAALAAEVGRRVSSAGRAAQGALRAMLDADAGAEVAAVLAVLQQDPAVRGVRLRGAHRSVLVGDPGGDTATQLPWMDAATARPVPLDRAVLMRLPFVANGAAWELDLVIDGQAVRARLWDRLVESQALNWLLLAGITLVGLLVIRRTIGEPMRQLVDAAGAGDAAALRSLARRSRNEFGQLADVLANLLARTAASGADLADRARDVMERWRSLPVAVLHVDAAGRLIESNAVAADLLAWPTGDPTDLAERDLASLVVEADRPAVAEALRRIAAGAGAQRLDVCIPAGPGRDAPRSCVLDLRATAAAGGSPATVQVAITDLSAERDALRAARQEAAALRTLLDEMSDGVLLCDPADRVLACNAAMAGVLQRPVEQIHGASASDGELWRRLSPIDGPDLPRRLANAAAAVRLASDRGVYQLRRTTLPLPGGGAGAIAWIAQDVTTRDRHERTVRDQDQRLRVVRQFSDVVAGVRDVDVLLERSVGLLHRLFDVEAVGVIVRGQVEGRRTWSMLYRGNVPHLVEPNRNVIGALSEHLLPEVLRDPATLHWSELDRHAPWGRACLEAGLTALAVAPLPGPAGGLGLLWIGHRAGRPIDAHHLAVLQTLAPLLASRIEVTQLIMRLREWGVADPGTDMLSHRELMPALVAADQASEPWSLLMIVPDQIEAVRRRLGATVADSMLLALAGRLASHTRLSSVLYRCGDDRFAMLVPRVAAAEAAHLARRLLAVAKSGHVSAGADGLVAVTLSIGVASSDADAGDGQDLLAASLGRALRVHAAGGDRVLGAPATRTIAA